MWPLYREEQERADERTMFGAKIIAREVAREVGRLFLPVWGYELKEVDTPAPARRCEHAFIINGACRDCGLRERGGFMGYGEAAPECETHDIVDGVCSNCGGRDMGSWVTSPSARVITCEHTRHEPSKGGGLRCLDCGEVGY
jgi:hypothetical protein